MPESLGSSSEPTDDEPIIVVVQDSSDMETRRGAATHWLRHWIATAEALFGVALAFLSVYLAVRPASSEHRPVWITLSAVCAVLFVAAVWCQNRVAIHEKKLRSEADRDRDKTARDMFALMTSMEHQIDELRTKRVDPGPQPVGASAVAISAPPTPSDEPDVSLRFQAPNRFVLHNYGGHATEVSIETVTIDAYVSEFWDSRPMRTPEQAVRFPIVEVDSGQSEHVNPIFTHFGIPVGNRTMVGFLDELIKRRRVDALGATGPPKPESSTPEEMLAYMRESSRLRDEPIEIEMKLWFSNRSTGRRWKRIETLHYEPTSGIAHVIHGKPR